MMGGQSSSQQQQQQTSVSQPWAPAQGLLTGILGQANGQLSNAPLNATENGALNTLSSNAQGGDPYAGQIGSLTTNLLNGGGATDQSGNISNALTTYQNQLTPYANGSMVGQITPQLQSYLDTIRGDVSNQVNGQFAAAGRDMSGMNQQTLARGIAQGEAQPLLNQYNQDTQNQLSAAGSLYGAGNTTGGLLAGLNQTALGNQVQGATQSQSALDAQNYGANQALNVEQLRRQIPAGNLGLLAQLGIPIAGLGGQVDSTGTKSGTADMSGAQQFGTIAGGIGNLAKLFG